MATNNIILLLVLSISCICSTRDVYIQPSEGEHCPGTTCYNINTFGKMAKNFSNSSGLVVHFLEGTHLLDLQELVLFKNLTNVVFEGDGRMEQGFHETVWQSTVVFKCTEHSSTGEGDAVANGAPTFMRLFGSLQSLSSTVGLNTIQRLQVLLLLIAPTFAFRYITITNCGTDS